MLTEHQRKIYEDAVYHDLSLSEIAEMQGISRQGVHDLIRRCDRILEDYEEKLHLVKRFYEMKENIHRIKTLAEDNSLSLEQMRKELKKLAGEMMEALV